jgi:hypothetical protein
MQEAMNGKAMKFRAIAEKRVSSVLRKVRGLGHLSRRSSYDYSPEQVAKMFTAVRHELDAAEQKFARPDRAQQEFTFD